eukprot:GHVT01068257.1.p1 GENE.GHVT01068257.1~~GHVT01068257.1.p1  ORF type:complete len:746 (+),score=228.67 GHVT01068257.1:84-2240(+)
MQELEKMRSAMEEQNKETERNDWRRREEDNKLYAEREAQHAQEIEKCEQNFLDEMQEKDHQIKQGRLLLEETQTKNEKLQEQVELLERNVAHLKATPDALSAATAEVQAVREALCQAENSQASSAKEVEEAGRRAEEADRRAEGANRRAEEANRRAEEANRKAEEADRMAKEAARKTEEASRRAAKEVEDVLAAKCDSDAQQQKIKEDLLRADGEARSWRLLVEELKEEEKRQSENANNSMMQIANQAQEQLSERVAAMREVFNSMVASKDVEISAAVAERDESLAASAAAQGKVKKLQEELAAALEHLATARAELQQQLEEARICAVRSSELEADAAAERRGREEERHEKERRDEELRRLRERLADTVPTSILQVAQEKASSLEGVVDELHAELEEAKGALAALRTQSERQLEQEGKRYAELGAKTLEDFQALHSRCELFKEQAERLKQELAVTLEDGGSSEVYRLKYQNEALRLQRAADRLVIGQEVQRLEVFREQLALLGAAGDEVLAAVAAQTPKDLDLSCVEADAATFPTFPFVPYAPPALLSHAARQQQQLLLRWQHVFYAAQRKGEGEEEEDSTATNQPTASQTPTEGLPLFPLLTPLPLVAWTASDQDVKDIVDYYRGQQQASDKLEDSHGSHDSTHRRMSAGENKHKKGSSVSRRASRAKPQRVGHFDRGSGQGEGCEQEVEEEEEEEEEEGEEESKAFPPMGTAQGQQ